MERIAKDHAAVMKPDVDSPFLDAADVVNRLLPYHVFQIPQHDLDAFIGVSVKGKEKAVEKELSG